MAVLLRTLTPKIITYHFGESQPKIHFNILALIYFVTKHLSYTPPFPPIFHMSLSIANCENGCWIAACFMFALGTLQAQVEVPAIHSNMDSDREGVYVTFRGEKYYDTERVPEMTLAQAMGNPEGTKIGIKFNFDKRGFSGKLYYGFIPYGDSKRPHPVFFKRWSEIEKG